MTFNHRAAALCSFTIAVIAFLFVPTIRDSFHDWTSWAFADLHIDYAGGLVRRGLLGEIAHRVRRYFDVSTADLFGYLFIALTAAQIALLAALAWPLARRWPAVFLAVMLSPALVLFPAYDSGGYFRKDIFIALGILGHALIARRVRGGTTSFFRYEIFLCFLALYLLFSSLVHENQVFFLPLHLVLVGLALRSFTLSRATLRYFAAVAVPISLAVLIILTHRGNDAIAQRICQSWKGLTPIDCSAINALGWHFPTLLALDLRIVLRPISLGLFALCLLLGLLPALAVREAARLDDQTPVPGKLMAVAGLPLAVLFALGWDWGRWISLIGLALAALALVSPPAQQPPQTSRRGGWFLLAAAIAYISSWKLNHCCEISSLDGGLIPSLLKSIQGVFGAR